MSQYDKALAQHDSKIRRYDKLGTCLNLSKQYDKEKSVIASEKER